MILQRLVELYDRLASDDATADALPKPGYSLQKCSFAVMLHPDGRLENFRSLLVLSDKNQKPIPRQLLVPGQAKPSGSGLNPCFLWDNAAYMLGYKADDPKPERTRESFETFRDKHLALEKQINSPAFSAVCAFLRQWTPEQAMARAADLEPVAGSFGVFQLVGAPGFIHDDPAVLSYWMMHGSGAADDNASQGFCLVTGEYGPIATLHEPKIKGVTGAQSAGALLVSFNTSAYESYGKSQGANAPVSQTAAFKYTNALNYLLNNPHRRISLGDATVVFWADRPSVMEDIAGSLLSDWGPPADTAPAEDKERWQQVRLFLSQFKSGYADSVAIDPDGEVKFYVLALSPNAARISVRFWYEGTVAELERRLLRHMRDTEIGGAQEPLTLKRMIGATCRIINDKPDYDTISPRLAGDISQAILFDRPYPRSLLTSTLARIGADGEISPARAAILKGYLNREGITVMDPYLNKVHEEQAYHCGRLLAVLAFAQECALKSVNSGVIRRMLGSVMASPGLQLGRLQRAAEVGHIPKLKKHLAAFVRDELKFINSALGNDVPLILQARQQGIFMLGFYQQMLFLEFTGTQVRDQRLLRTRQGEWVRSKGEVRLANLLTKRGIRYIYEPVATLASGPERYPDFVVWGTHPNETIYIEYLGMNTLEYNSRWQRKLQAYHESGITESGGPEGRLVVIDAREKELDDLAMLNILEPVFGAAPKHKGTKE